MNDADTISERLASTTSRVTEYAVRSERVAVDRTSAVARWFWSYLMFLGGVLTYKKAVAPGLIRMVATETPLTMLDARGLVFDLPVLLVFGWMTLKLWFAYTSGRTDARQCLSELVVEVRSRVSRTVENRT